MLNSVGLKKSIMSAAVLALFIPGLVAAMQINIKRLPDGKISHLTVEQTDTIATVKDKIDDKQGIPQDQQRLYVSGSTTELTDSQTLKAVGIQEGGTLDMKLKLAGG